MFLGRKRKYFTDYFCTEFATRTGHCPPEARAVISQLVDAALAEAKDLGLEGLDQPLGEAVLAPGGPAARKSMQVLSFSEKVHSVSMERWRAEGVTPAEVVEYWNHGALSHFCYTEFDAYFLKNTVVGIAEAFSERSAYEDVGVLMSDAQSEALKLWPLYGPVREPHLAMDERDRPLPVESRMWVDRWRFRMMAEDPKAISAALTAASSFNAAARAARAADPHLAGALKAAGLPAPVFGLAAKPEPSGEGPTGIFRGVVGAPAPVELGEQEDGSEPDDEEFYLGEYEFESRGDDEAEEQEAETEDWSREYAPALPFLLDWPIPIRLGDEAVRLYRNARDDGEATFTDSVTIPCALRIRSLQVPGVLCAAWLDKPDFEGQRLFLEFKQNDAIDAGEPSWIGESSMHLAEYLVETSPAHYSHRSPYRTPNYRGPGLGSGHDLALRLVDDDGDEWDLVIPWAMGDPSEDEKAEILSRLKVALGLFDRHLASVRDEEL